MKAAMNYGARLFLKAKKRGTPILLARLSGVNGPMLALQEVDEFTRDSKNLQSLLVANGVGNKGELILRPFITNLTVDLSMFAHASTFANGATTLAVNTDQFDKVYDPVTAETIAVLHLTIEMPQGENSFCFNYAIDQHSSHGSPVAATITVNNVAYKFSVEPTIVPIGSSNCKLMVTTEKPIGLGGTVETRNSITVTGKCNGGPIGTKKTFTIDSELHTIDVGFDAGNTAGIFSVSWTGSNTYGDSSVDTAGVITVVEVEKILYIGKEGSLYVTGRKEIKLTAIPSNATETATGEFPSGNPIWSSDKFPITVGQNTAEITLDVTQIGEGKVIATCGSSVAEFNVASYILEHETVNVAPTNQDRGRLKIGIDEKVIIKTNPAISVTWTASSGSIKQLVLTGAVAEYTGDVATSKDTITATPAFGIGDSATLDFSVIMPTGEVSSFEGWNVEYKGTWKALILPDDVSFSGKLVVEKKDKDQNGYDTLWDQYVNAGRPPGNTQLGPLDTITGGTWTVRSDNTYGDDYIWMRGDIIKYYQGQNMTGESAMYQSMQIDTINGGLLEYKKNVLKRGVLSKTSIFSERDGMRMIKTYPASSNHAPVATDVAVEVRPGQKLQYIILKATDADGDSLTYSLMSPATWGNAAVEAELGSYESSQFYIANGDHFMYTAYDGNTNSNEARVNITYKPFILSGSVTCDGAGLVGVTITANYSSNTATATTDATGAFSVANLGVTNVVVTPSLAGYKFTPESATVSITNNDVSGVNFTAEGTLSISGSVSYNGNTFPGVLITVGGKSVRTDAQGNYTISGLAPGTYTVTSSFSGNFFTPVQKEITLTTTSANGVKFVGSEGP